MQDAGNYMCNNVFTATLIVVGFPDCTPRKYEFIENRSVTLRCVLAAAPQSIFEETGATVDITAADTRHPPNFKVGRFMMPLHRNI